MQHISLVDRLIGQFDKCLKAFSSDDSNSAMDVFPKHPSLSIAEAKASAALMRVNHTGEVCAQALYLGQAWVARKPQLAESLYKAAEEEKAHLNWCRIRLSELNGRVSVLNPFFGVGALGLGALAGLLGDKISLGFLAETENQVSRHLEKHLHCISKNDQRSIAILKQMQQDEQKHETSALNAGGMQLPYPIRRLMALCAKVMTQTTRYI